MVWVRSYVRRDRVLSFEHCGTKVIDGVKASIAKFEMSNRPDHE
jgi:hypothetical protein